MSSRRHVVSTVVLFVAVAAFLSLMFFGMKYVTASTATKSYQEGIQDYKYFLTGKIIWDSCFVSAIRDDYTDQNGKKTLDLCHKGINSNYASIGQPGVYNVEVDIAVRAGDIFKKNDSNGVLTQLIIVRGTTEGTVTFANLMTKKDETLSNNDFIRQTDVRPVVTYTKAK